MEPLLAVRGRGTQSRTHWATPNSSQWDKHVHRNRTTYLCTGRLRPRCSNRFAGRNQFDWRGGICICLQPSSLFAILGAVGKECVGCFSPFVGFEWQPDSNPRDPFNPASFLGDLRHAPHIPGTVCDGRYQRGRRSNKNTATKLLATVFEFLFRTCCEWLTKVVRLFWLPMPCRCIHSGRRREVVWWCR